jgi:4-methyl-5(b-hydroxyethyl)-thiazole monophosphate biosynthesis
MPRVLVPLAEGFEEIEAVTVIDLLRRAGIEVVTAGLGPGPVTGSHDIVVTPDTDLEAALGQAFDLVALPGGMPGAANLAADARLLALLCQMATSGRITAAICAAPGVLAKAGLLAGKRATSYPGFLDAQNAPGAILSEEPVVEDGRVITSRGPGTAMDFALALIERLEGAPVRRKIEAGLQRPGASAPA